MRYEVRAGDKHGDLGVLVATYHWRWRANRHLRRAEHSREHYQAMLVAGGYQPTGWHYYIRQVP